uniref:Mannose-6-phosphate isomerase, cupin superfamily n=1 Tax=Candidatus Kentrum sp. TUN TaxID=2126343 RepID=A0A451A6D1_9GAMM|nr:MAG: Mannose-6-phosphate isomerase, cupin superfamily [Candidatus Kentron sp. TUN]VFK70404.1 MAG: Mannose-6-phosphate isomerase, cupin superfamily [Candidatus Kentron sp. TUN]
MNKITNIQDIEQVRGHCGTIRRMTTDGPARFIHLLVNDAERHYHEKTTEYYYVLNGEGRIYLDGKIRDIKKGDLVTIPPGTIHNAIEQDGPLEIMVIEVPPAIDDVFKTSEATS